MTDKKTQQPNGVASDLNAELDTGDDMSEKTITATDKKQLIKAEKLKIQILKTADMLQEYISFESSNFRKKGEYEKIHGSQDVRFKMIEDMRFYAQSLRVNGD